ncbi:right-handed parallel beta-helix repeat-containing protein [Mesorhizobium sp. RP14(2022)]|uniref:Right-handed parallel beta-helix repeat-containing protein n=1 Tax=Mesorhizobium liriopis TaxID=2953882 RepID=A0ABT1C2R9_9HYPH|nr:right-handed parallel beta-helix repeat-containing protein [Mesorhizobium liriopis]MCO6049125.1 right-handed parallel beta-helix repeat-containing protein [Mesorhizobium liriopis]
MPLSSTATLAGFPEASTTGVRPGTTLKTVDDLVVTTPGAVISGLEIHGTLRIEADNVTIRDCKIVGDSYNSVQVVDGHSGATVEYCDIVGGTNGIMGGGTFRYNDISKNENGIVTGGPSLIEGNYIHDMSGGPEAHFDGIEINGGHDITIRHNTVINDYGQTSAIMIDNYFGPVDNVVVSDNYLAGGGYTIYSDGQFSSSNKITNVQITDNQLGSGSWGYYSVNGNSPAMSGNVEIGKSWPTPVADAHPTSPAAPDPTPAPTKPTPAPPAADDTTHHGTSGADVLKGGTGDDTFIVNHAGDKVVELSGQGNDTVESSVSYSLGRSSIENLHLTGSDAINGRGNSLDNSITGNDANNSLFGGSGNDVLNGWGGKDTLYGGTGNDTFVFSSKFSVDGDRVADFAKGDKLDFSMIDPGVARGGAQAFLFDGYGEGKGDGHIWVTEDSDTTHVHGQVDGFEFNVALDGTHLALTAADIIV